MLTFKPLTKEHKVKFIQAIRKAKISQHFKGWFWSEPGECWIIINEHPVMDAEEFNESCEISCRTITLTEDIAGTFEAI